MIRALKLAAIALCAAVLTCGGQEIRLNVLLIGIDTLRFDHLGCYGYERNTTPNIDKLASGGVIAERAISQAPWTLPSFATVFTSLYPEQHGALRVDSRVRDSAPTLAEILRDSGYATGAVVNAPLLGPQYGLDRGFDFYDTTPIPTGRTADEVTRSALEWIEHNREGPFFLFAHYFDPHLSYSPPAPYDDVFDPDYDGPLGRTFDLDYFSSRNASAIREELVGLTEADRRHIIALYDGEIAFTDSAVGALLDGLRAMGLEERTLVVILSDHGEEFFDHGGLDHGHTLFEELIRVPLILSLPGLIPANKTLSRQVRLLDIAPTILDYLDPPPYEHFEGVSLKPLIEGSGSAVSSVRALLPRGRCLSGALRRNESLRSMTAFPWKLIEDLSSGEQLLFDLERDPGEQFDVSDQNSEEVETLRYSIIRTVFGLSDAWYVRMSGDGEPHVFDLSIKVSKNDAPGNIGLHSIWTGERVLARDEDMTATAAGNSVLRIGELTVTDTLTLALMPRPRLASLEFDLRIDGEPATSRTLLGRSDYTRPHSMPFTQSVGVKVFVEGDRPVSFPDPPLYHIWHEPSRFSGRTNFKLDERAKKELRALGYIQ
jgi:arylsulfatase A-like enzyme